MSAVSPAVLPTDGHRLRGHFPRSMTTVHGKTAIGFGAPFFIMGLLGILASLGVVPMRKADLHAPKWVVAACGMVFFGPGAWLILHGVRGCLSAARLRRQRQSNPMEPWRADHAWNPAHAADDGNRRLSVRGLQFLMLVVFTAPFNYIGFFTKGALAWRLLFAGVADLILLTFGGAFIYHVVQRVRFGPSRLQYRRFPFFVGERLDVEFVPSRSIGAFHRLTATLRCVREEYVTTPPPRKRTEIVSHLLYAESKPIAEAGSPCAGAVGFPFSFSLPDGDFETCLSNPPPRYWEIEIAADTPGWDYKAVFLVPVYRRPGRSPACAAETPAV